MPSGHFDYQYGDLEVLNEYREQVSKMAQLVEEMFETNPVNLLSPYLRKLMAAEAKKLGKLHSLIAPKLIVDNPGRPLKDEI